MSNPTARAALAALALAALYLSACKDQDPAVAPTPTASTPVTVTNLAPAAVNPVALASKAVASLAPQPSSPGSTGQPLTPRHYTFYSLETSAQIAYTDSATAKWDVAFRGTTILVNGGTSGPGQGQAQVVATLFEDLATAPASGYKADAATGKAIPTGSGNGWYTYDSNTHLISATPGRIIALKTATGKYAKLEVKSYYKDAPAAPTTSTPSGYYHFRYVYQADGSTNLK